MQNATNNSPLNILLINAPELFSKSIMDGEDACQGDFQACIQQRVIGHQGEKMIYKSNIQKTLKEIL